MERELREIAGAVCRGEATKEQEMFIVASYFKVFRKPFSACKCQLCDAIFLILKNLDKMECNYRLKKGIVLTNFGKGYRLTHLNITDKLAKQHLKDKPGDAVYFDHIPQEEKPQVNDDLGQGVELPVEDKINDDKAEVKIVKRKPARKKKR